MNNGDLDKIIFTEMVKQIGDLGNYILKAIITIYGVSLVALLLAALRIPADSSISSLAETQLSCVIAVVFVALNLAIWWVTRTFIASHIVIDSKIERPSSASTESKDVLSKIKRVWGRFLECSIMILFMIEKCPRAARSVSLAGIMFFVVSLALTAAIMSEFRTFARETTQNDPDREPVSATPDLESVTIEDPALEVYDLDPVTTEEADP